MKGEKMLNHGIMMLHVLFGVLGILCAVALLVDVLNAGVKNYQRIKMLSLAVAVLLVVSFIIGGYWYVTFYGAERDIIKAGAWPWAHNFFMEVKEHVFFAMLLLGVYLPIADYKNTPLTSRKNKNLVLAICAMIILLGVFMEGAGGIISKGVTMGLRG